MTTGLRLSGDSDQPMSSHLDELTGRAGLLLFALMSSSLLWMWWIDDVLAQYLQLLSPCSIEECLSVYAPAEWVAMRWLSIVLLGLVSIIPIICWQALSFAKPGLLPRERRWLGFFIILGGGCGMLLIAMTMAWLLPYLMLIGHESGATAGVVASYDAVEMLRLSLAVAAVELVVLLALMASILAGVTGLMSESNVTWWRWRLHGISLFLIWAAIPSHLTGVRLLTMIVSSTMLEASILPFTSSLFVSRALPPGEGILDAEGGLRRMAVVSCMCAGACQLDAGAWLPESMASHQANALCLSADERDELIEEARFQRWTDILITGCDSTPLPEHLQQSMDALSVRLRGLSLLDIVASRPDGRIDHLDLELALATVSDPWPQNRVSARVLDVVIDGPLHIAESFPWGLVLESGSRFARTDVLPFEETGADVILHLGPQNA
ncbi:MAG: twin-arginine translocase subunit TatC [Candidatus Poseidoniaceae archaeon]|jgi:Sec-independent protein secretion pathway component TatC|nr:twin-arginine translocase subunit TatC [Candidatus Poseidoniaceae archaeon]